ncbi:metallo-beta-lactamase superfamily protein [Dactylonectria estremocensis]|uniref:Metallo-beta-lactamase superfamily protein n=1 Tax=Dactylonectria estremocensis TaxID=1079267 RepID=A0A9P9DZE7_9HYPO|nr:metallo-beta-lactamase superfamily protein [Dactylonectria estremocensis]
MSSVPNLFASAAVPAFKCPPGTKVFLLNLGILRGDEGWFLQGANASSASNPNPENKSRELISLAVLIDHPEAGLLLFETGCAENLDVKWGAPLTDVFPRVLYTEEHKLPNAIKACGYDIKDVKGVIFGHLHLDHAGGLEHFLGTDVPIYVHEEEFKHACWCAATGADAALYLADYLSLDKLNWKTFSDTRIDLFQGITLHLGAGHTPGLCIMQVNLDRDGTFIFTSDHYHVKENHTLRHPQGWLAREHTSWIRTSEMVERLQRLFKATLVYGHDLEVADALIKAKPYYE